MERSVSCVYSRDHLKETLEKYGVRFSDYGSQDRSGPTVGMALVTLAHYEYSDVAMFRLGVRAPMYPFLTANDEQVGMATDHRSFYGIMRRLKNLFKLDIDLSELQSLGDAESGRLQELLDKISASSVDAKEIIDQARQDFDLIPYVEHVELGPALDSTLQEILRNAPPDPKTSNL